MRILALDLSTKTGWALLEGEMGQIPKIIETGVISNDAPVSNFGEFPFSYYFAAAHMANSVHLVSLAKMPDRIIIEEINKPGRFGNRYSQKVLDFIHCLLLQLFNDHPLTRSIPVDYINTTDWRRVVGARLTVADKKMNIKVRQLKKKGDKAGIKALGVRGKISKKHVAIRYVNATFGLSLKMKDNDIADAICQGTAYFLGAPLCDGK